MYPTTQKLLPCFCVEHSIKIVLPSRLFHWCTCSPRSGVHLANLPRKNEMSVKIELIGNFCALMCCRRLRSRSPRRALLSTVARRRPASPPTPTPSTRTTSAAPTTAPQTKVRPPLTPFPVCLHSERNLCCGVESAGSQISTVFSQRLPPPPPNTQHEKVGSLQLNEWETASRNILSLLATAVVSFRKCASFSFVLHISQMTIRSRFWVSGSKRRCRRKSRWRRRRRCRRHNPTPTSRASWAGGATALTDPALSRTGRSRMG